MGAAEGFNAAGETGAGWRTMGAGLVAGRVRAAEAGFGGSVVSASAVSDGGRGRLANRLRRGDDGGQGGCVRAKGRAGGRLGSVHRRGQRCVGVDVGEVEGGGGGFAAHVVAEAEEASTKDGEAEKDAENSAGAEGQLALVLRDFVVVEEVHRAFLRWSR